MARPARADAEATKRTILQTAARLFSERGLGSTTMRQIAREAGVSMATAHHYFGGKDDLYRAAVDAMARQLHQLRAELEPVFTGARSIDEALEVAVRRAYQFARRHRPAVQLVMRTVLDSGELDPTHRDHVLLPTLDRGAAVLAPLLGRPPEAVWMSLLSINYLVVRFALNSRQELERIAARAGPGQDVDEAVADQLVSIARAILLRPDHGDRRG